MEKWWEDPPKEVGLSQGDILAELPFSVPVLPTVRLGKVTGKKGALAWTPTEKLTKHLLAVGGCFPAIVISHDCELDKKEKKARVLVAPIKELEGLPENVQTQILEQKRRSLMPLPGVPNLGGCYADLRLICATDRASMTDETRVASMTELGVRRLQAQLVAFFTRKDDALP